MRSPRHEWARKFATAGKPVFPCKVMGKHPAGHLAPEGFKDATADPATIDAWFSQGDWNYAFRPWELGCVVIDPDLYKGVEKEFLDKLPPTRTVATPRGGKHLYYKTAIPYGNVKLGVKNVDVRCAMGYVLGPGSVTEDGEYVLVDDRPPVELTPELIAMLGEGSKPKERAKAPDGLTEDDDCPELLKEADWRIRHHIEKYGIGTDPRGDRAYALANYLGDIRWMQSILSTEKIIELMQDAGYGDVANDILDRRQVGDRGCAIVMDDPPESDGTIKPLWIDHTAEQWMRRSLPERKKLIGPFNTASRGMIVAPTGLGKTMFGLALAGAVATGGAVFKGKDPRWDAPEAKTILYIDGEMPPALLKERVIELAGRAGDFEGRLILLSMADFREVQPFDTREGQAWVDMMIDRYGAHAVIFDNIQALTRGDMKDSEGWRGMLPWMQTITDRGVAQIWIHHANADGSMYGDKTRAWALDTVLILKRTKGELGELVFEVSFDQALGGKHRERHPGKNDREYQNGIAKLQGNQWRWVDKAKADEDALKAVLAEHGTMSTDDLRLALGVSRQALEKNIPIWDKYISKDRSLKGRHWCLPLREPTPQVEP